MATQPHPANVPPTTPPNAPAGAAPAVAPPSPYPGGMASDPAVALANEIVTNIKGAYEKQDLSLPMRSYWQCRYEHEDLLMLKLLR
jgi:hypothetical protein